MKLAAIYNVWGDTADLLNLSINNIKPHVDLVIVVWSRMSNYGQEDTRVFEDFRREGVLYHQHEPRAGMPAYFNERSKRQAGLAVAKSYDCTHFIMMDGDEFYEPLDIENCKQSILKHDDIDGIVVSSINYFKSPRLRVQDKTLVPFIHKLYPNTVCGMNKKYPYAWIDGQIRIDPTRQLNHTGNIAYLSQITMHHYSWVRSSYRDKIENSTARDNIKNSTILRDLLEAKEGYFCEFYGQYLQRAAINFNIPELADDSEIHKLMAGTGSHSS